MKIEYSNPTNKDIKDFINHALAVFGKIKDCSRPDIFKIKGWDLFCHVKFFNMLSGTTFFYYRILFNV
jgi:hypothetical protein